MKNLRNRLALAAAAVLLCLAPVACSDGPTSSPAGARRSTTADSANIIPKAGGGESPSTQTCDPKVQVCGIGTSGGGG